MNNQSDVKAGLYIATKALLNNSLLKINRLNQLIMKRLLEAASPEVSIDNTDEGTKAESVNSKMSGSQSFRGSFMIPVTTLYILMFAERLAQILNLY